MAVLNCCHAASRIWHVQVSSGRSAKNLQQSQNNDVMVVETREYLGGSEGDEGDACYPHALMWAPAIHFHPVCLP